LPQIRELLDSTLHLLGLFCLGRPGNQDVLRWGQSPNILHLLLCGLPFEYFADPHHRRVLMPTLLAAAYDSPAIAQVQSRSVLKHTQTHAHVHIHLHTPRLDDVNVHCQRRGNFFLCFAITEMFIESPPLSASSGAGRSHS
jgi:hypothetical protein